MQVNALNHTYADQVSSHYSNGPFSTENPIGLADEVSDDIIIQKSEELRNEISEYNLRDISPDDLRKLGGYLFEAGEISGNAASEFIMTGQDFGNESSIDAISYLEERYARIKEIDRQEQGFSESVKMYGDALHTLYNLESFIKGSREHIGIDVKV